MKIEKKKLLYLCLSLMMAAVIGAGASMAYFTDSAKRTNVFTMGHVDIELAEPSYEGDEQGTIRNLLPGSVIPKDPTVTIQQGSQDSYVRVRLDITGLNETQKAQLLERNSTGAYLHFDIGTEWTQSGEYFYYTGLYETGQKSGVLKEGQSVTLFTKVTLPGDEWGNEMAIKTFSIQVQAEAIQADNFEPRMESGEYGWYTKNGGNITTETYPKG